MKNIKQILLSGILALFLSACSKNSTMNTNNNDPVKENNFNSSEEAVNKGKNDLISLVKNNREFNLGLDLAALEKSMPGKAVSEGIMSFDRLLQYRQDSISALVEDSRRLSTPLVAENNVVSIIGTTKTEKGWQLGALGNKSLTADLTELRNHTSLEQAQISRIEVPNLQAVIYEVTNGRQKQYFTTYGGRSLQRSVNPSELMKQLQADAVSFQREFGDQLKNNRLVK